MSASNPPVVPALRDLLAEDRRALGDHPEVEEWMAFRAGLLEGARVESLRDHLSICRECADLVLDLAAFTGTAPPEGTSPVSDAQVKAALWQIQGTLGREAPPAAGDPQEVGRYPEKVEERRPAVEVREMASQSGKRHWHIPVGLIAASLLAVAGVTTWNLLRPATPTLQANVRLTDETRELIAHEESPDAPGARRGGRDLRSRNDEPLSADEEHSVGLPIPRGTVTFEGYYLEVADPAGDLVFETGDLEVQSGMDKGSGDGFTLGVPRGLRAGHYTVQIYGVDPGRSRELIASYRFEVTP